MIFSGLGHHSLDNAHNSGLCGIGAAPAMAITSALHRPMYSIERHIRGAMQPSASNAAIARGIARGMRPSGNIRGQEGATSRRSIINHTRALPDLPWLHRFGI